MRYIFFILSLFMLTNIGAQDVDKKEKRKQEKERREKEIVKNYNATVAFVEGKKFVLEANFLQDKYGNRISVSKAINFIYVNSDDAILQIGNTSGAGYNGVGGVTIEGKINKWKFNKDDKRHTIYLELGIMGSTGIYDVVLNIDPNRQTSAVLTSLSSGSIEYFGDLVSLEKSRVYKARTTY